MSEADFCGMDAGEYYAARDFEDRERAHSPEADMVRKIKNQRTQIEHLTNRIRKIEQGRERCRLNYREADAALSIASKWLEQAGTCTHHAGYTCDKDFTTPGVCAACIRRHMLKLAREGGKT